MDQKEQEELDALVTAVGLADDWLAHSHDSLLSKTARHRREANVYDNPTAKFRAFVDAVDVSPEDSANVEIPAWVAEAFAVRFRWFVNYVDGGGKHYSALAPLLGFHGKGSGHTTKRSKAKKEQMHKATCLAWVLHISEVNGISISPDQAATNYSVVAEEDLPEPKGYSRSSLMKAWKLHGSVARKAVQILTGTGGLRVREEDWPHLAKVAATKNPE